jgi:DNA polymerase III alpha subunit
MVTGELHAASAFSFLEGASEPEKLIERALELEMPAMALLDRNGVYGSARFHTSARRNELRAHVGAEIAVSSLGSRPRRGCRISTLPNQPVFRCSVRLVKAIRISVA